MDRIPLKRAQELRGKLKHWPVRNRSLATETKYADKLLGARAVVINPRGSLRELNQPYIVFWDSMETVRIHLLTGSSLSQSYSSSYSRVLTLEKLLSFPEVKTSLVWLGSDATPNQCDAVDFTNKVCARPPFSFCVRFMASLTGMPGNYFVLIALAEYIGIFVFLDGNA